MGLIGIYVAGTEETRETERERVGESNGGGFSVVPYFYSVFIIFHAAMKCKPI